MAIQDVVPLQPIDGPVYSCIQLHTAVYSCIRLYTAVYSCIQLYNSCITVVYSCITAVYTCIQLYTLAYSFMQLYTAVYSCILASSRYHASGRKSSDGGGCFHSDFVGSTGLQTIIAFRRVHRMQTIIAALRQRLPLCSRREFPCPGRVRIPMYRSTVE